MFEKVLIRNSCSLGEVVTAGTQSRWRALSKTRGGQERPQRSLGKSGLAKTDPSVEEEQVWEQLSRMTCTDLGSLMGCALSAAGAGHCHCEATANYH